MEIFLKPTASTGQHIIPPGVLRCLTCALLLMLYIFFFHTTCPAAENHPKAADLVSEDQPIDLTSERYTLLFNELSTVHGFDREQLTVLFKDLRIHRKVLELMDKQWEAKPYYDYRPLFVTPAVIHQGQRNLEQYGEIFDRVEAAYGVNREVIVAIWAIESRFGSNQGSFELFRSLNTLFDAYPRRSEFFRKELIHFLVLCRANGLDPLSVKGSYAGAFGQAQFMPSSFNEYAVDFDDDGHTDLISSIPDIFASIAHYLSRFGWQLNATVYADIGDELKSPALVDVYRKGKEGTISWEELAKTQNIPLDIPPNGQELSIIGLERSPFEGGGYRYVAVYPNFAAIKRYNNSNKYAMAVSEMARAFSQ